MNNNPTPDRLVKNLRDAQRRVRSALVANADRLDTPFTDDPGKNPWDTFVRPAMRELQDAVNAACEALTAAVSSPPATRADDRAAVLADAEGAIRTVTGNCGYKADDGCDFCNGVDAALEQLRRLADEAQQPPVGAQQPDTETRPARGDQFEAWLKAFRDACGGQTDEWHAFDAALDRYRLHADTGTPLGEHVCEARVVGQCECLEQPASGPAVADEAQPARHTGGNAEDCPACIANGIHKISYPWTCPGEQPETPEVVHGCPPDGSGLTPCCGRTPFELPLGDRISSEAPVTCRGAQ